MERPEGMPRCTCAHCKAQTVQSVGLIERIYRLFFKRPQQTERNPNVNWDLVEEMFGSEPKWKQGVLPMKASWYNEPLPDEGELAGLEHGSRDIHPCSDEVDNTKCPCNKAHLLHWKKEPLSYYRNAVWGTKCAIEDLLCYLEHTITNLKGHVEARDEELHQKSINLHDGIKLLTTLVSQVAQREEHLMDCPAIDPIIQMRSKGKIECNCGLLALQETITAVHRWLNGR